MQNGREIVTLQLGDYANHVAAHYWNIEWENANLNEQSAGNKDDDDDNYSNKSTNNHSTNPSKTAKYLNSKRRSQPTQSSHSGTITKRDESNKNINPNICFHSNKQHQASLHSIKNKLNTNNTIYTPRTIIFAAHGSEGDINSNVYNSSTKETKSNNDKNTIFTWNHGVNIIQQQRTRPQSLANKTINKSNCQYWSDYLLPTLHHKSLFLLDGIHHFATPFYSYSTGYDLLNGGTTSSSDLSEEIDDRIRWFVESCDWFQGFQTFASSYDSFSGFLPSLMNRIHDDYNNKCIMLYDCNPSSVTMHKTNQYANDYSTNKSSVQTMSKRFRLNSIVSMSQVWNEVSNIIPISVDYWDRTDDESATNNKFYNTSIVGSCLHHYTNAVRLNNSNVRLMDIINCSVKRSTMKMSMLSSCSSHLDLDMNYQAIDSIERLLLSKETKKKQPIFPRLSCLGPIKNKEFADEDNLKDIFGEYSCLNGSNLYGTSAQVIQEWKQKKMILAQKQGSSKSDIELYCDQWKYDSEKRNYHLKLMAKLASKSQQSLKWMLVSNTWKLPSTHPFYYDTKSDKTESKIDDEEANQQEKEKRGDTNNYSIWSSGWSANIIGKTYLKECGESVTSVINYGMSKKIFGDVEMDLSQYQEELMAYADAYCPTEQI